MCIFAANNIDETGLQLGGYAQHQQKLKEERKQEYIKFLAQVYTYFLSYLFISSPPYGYKLYSFYVQWDDIKDKDQGNR